jgi:hypothetical protein
VQQPAAAPVDELPFVLVWQIKQGVLQARCQCGEQFEARDPVPVLDWLEQHPHRNIQAG